VVKESEDEDKVKLRFSIKDSGIGIPQDKIPNLFEEFTQADSSTTRKYGGTGLGLAICKKLSELMGGTIWAESEPGQGSTFIFTVICGKQDKQVEHRYKLSLDLRGMKVLVVDDNSDAREIFQSYLENFSFKVTTAASGQEAIKELEQNSQLKDEKPYDLILIDWKMPGMDGIETSKNIKQRLGVDKSPKIVMLTAFGREELMKQAEQAGIDGFLIKPVNQSILFDTIMSVFGQESHVSQRKAGKSADYTDQLRKIRGASILLAEDNEINQQVASELLEKEQLMVSIANNGKEAVEAVANWDYDVVLMDIQMPELNGYETTQEIKKNEQYKNLPIIAMTAHAMASDHEKCLEAGMVDVITKPIDPDKMFATLLKWIKPGDRDTISEVEEEEPQEEDKVKLPSKIAGIDIPTGLTRVGGNKKLFKKLLLSFRESNGNTPEKIKEALEKGDMELAERLAHTVKGVSGNFAANNLYNAAGALEVAIKDEDTSEIDHLLAAFSEELNIIIQAISVLKRVDDIEAETNSQQDDVEVDKAVVIPLLEELKVLMEEDFSEAEGKLEKLKKLLGPTKFKSAFANLESQIDGYDFDSAVETIDNIRATFEGI
jgi:CheY-like chemotaxis protein